MYKSALFLLLCLFAGTANAQNRLTGDVRDAESGEPVAAASIAVMDTNIGTSADEDGSFVFPELREGEHTLVVRSMGYQPYQMEISIPDYLDEPLLIELSPAVTAMQELIIVSSILRTGSNYQPEKIYSGEELNRRANISVGQMLDGEPGIAMRSFGAVPTRPVIRGFDGERLLILENGERMGDISESSVDHAIALDPAATETIEVIRGPSGLLFGNNALGGVVNLVTSDIPRDMTSGMTGVASFHGASMNGLVHGYSRMSYGMDNQAFTGRFSYREAGNVQTPDGRLPGTSMSAMEGSLGWSVNRDDTQWGLSILGMDHVYQIPESVDDPNEHVEIRYNRQGLQMQMRSKPAGFFDAVQLRSHASRYDHKEVEVGILEDGKAAEEVEITYLQWAYSATASAEYSNFGVIDNGTVGFNINGRNFDIGGEEAYSPGDVTVNPAVFALQEAGLSNFLTLQIGSRLDFRYVSTIPNELNAIETDRSNLDLSAAIGLNYNPNFPFEFGVQMARSHRYPTIEELYSDGAHLAAGAYEIGDPTLETERTYGMDAFIRWHFNRISFEAAGFYSYIENYIAFQPQGLIDPSSGLPVFRYVGDGAQIHGGEISSLLRFSEQFSAELGLDYVSGSRLNRDREPLPFMPPFRSRLVVNYDFGRSFLGARLRLVTSQKRVAPEEDTTEGYFLAGLSAGHRFGNDAIHSITLRVDNLLNQRYRDHLSRVEDRDYPMPGRNVTLNYRWYF